MKKILSVALSTAMAFSMFASVAFGDTAVTPQQKFDALKAKGIFSGYPDGTAGLEKDMTRAEFAKVITKLLGLKEITGQLSYTDQNYTAKNWAVPYIEAVTAAGIMEGKNVEKKIFDFNGKVTVSEMATILTRALDLEIPAETNNSAPAWAKGYVQAAINAGFLDANANFTANASRELLVGAAYVIDEAQNLKVSSYEVSEAGKVVTFKISDGESVKVTLDTALVANKETEVKFTYKDKEFTEKVTYVTTVAQAVASASATNLKEVTVKFDGTVDPASAETASNYTVSGVSFTSATLSDDKTTVTLLVSESSSALTNQKSTTLTINNVKNADATKTFSQKVTFTPLDVAVPEVKEVKALGTKAFKVVFSEPVKASSVNATSFRIDGNVIAASVKYVYPNTAIVTTNLTAGEHTLRVSGVEDFSGLSIVPVENKFTATEDTAAPQVVSVKSNDLKEVTVEFDETVKSVASAYANVSGNTASSIVINDNKVTLTFSNPLNYTENTIHLATVSDYSNNTANVDTKVTPTLDTVRPTVVSSDFEVVNGNYIATLTFSKALDKTSAETASKYVLKKSDGTVPSVAGITSDGYPVIQPEYNATNRTVTINLGSNLNASTVYTLTASGIIDTAYVGNVLLPYTVTLNAETAQNGSVSRVWADVDTTNNVKPTYIYIKFNKTLATSGEGNALEAAKYTVRNADGAQYQIAKEDSDINLISTDTIRLTTTGTSLNNITWNANNLKVVASYIKDADGNYFVQNGSYSLEKDLETTSTIAVTGDVYATSRSQVKLTFTAGLSNVNVGDFVLTSNGSTYTPNSYTLSSDNKTLYLKFSSNVVSYNSGATLSTTSSVSTQDAFGNKIATFTGKSVKDGIAPAVASSSITRNGNTFTASIVATENLTRSGVTDAYLRSLFTLTAGTQTGTITDVEITDNADGNRVIINVTGTVANTPNASDLVTLQFDGTKNEAAKAITDTSDNAIGEFNVSKLYKDISAN